jgi:hypothetical protein
MGSAPPVDAFGHKFPTCTEDATGSVSCSAYAYFTRLVDSGSAGLAGNHGCLLSPLYLCGASYTLPDFKGVLTNQCTRLAAAGTDAQNPRIQREAVIFSQF